MIEYVSVAEYAKIKAISQQAVYKQINNGKVEYIEKTEKGKKVKYIKYSHTERETKPIQPTSVEVENIENEEVLNSLNSTNQPTKLNQFNQPNQPKAEETEFQTVIRILQAQLEEKDKQIERLQEQNAKQAEENRIKDNTIKEALEKAQTLQAQVNLLLLDGKKEPKEEVIDIQENAEQAERLHNQSRSSITQEPEHKKKTFWQRLFGIE